MPVVRKWRTLMSIFLYFKVILKSFLKLDTIEIFLETIFHFSCRITKMLVFCFANFLKVGFKSTISPKLMYNNKLWLHWIYAVLDHRLQAFCGGRLWQFSYGKAANWLLELSWELICWKVLWLESYCINLFFCYKQCKDLKLVFKTVSKKISRSSSLSVYMY